MQDPTTIPATRPSLEAVAGNVGDALQQSTGTSQLVVLGVIVVVVPLVVAMHYEAMRLLVKIVHPIGYRPRASLIGVILGLLVAHLLEIIVFGVTYIVLASIGTLGGLHVVGTPGEALSAGRVDWFYFSAVVYSTVGFGDLVPFGPLRLLAAVESVLGLMLVTWSASFTYLQMQAGWREAFEPKG